MPYHLLSLATPHFIALFSLILIAAIWHRYTVRRDSFIAYYKRNDYKRNDAKGAPLTFPYIFPLLGSLPVTYLWNPRGFVLNRKNFFQSEDPVRVKILTQEFYIIRGSENVKALFKNSWACTPIPFVKFALEYAFGLPAKASSLYDKDDSGDGPVPHPGSMVEARNRISYRDHESLIRFMEGKGLLPFFNRFSDNITQQLHSLQDRVGSDWDYHADLMKVVGDETSVSILNALCGPYLLKQNPNFLQDYWEFDSNLQTYLQGIPRFIAPAAYAVRKRLLNAVKVWQQHARDHFNESAIDADGDDPFWGSSFFRERQEMFLEMDGFDHAAIASQDFGAIWALRNSITAASWAIFEIYRDPELLASVRAEVETCALKCTNGRDVRFNIDELLRLPVLQAVYAETLRLRMHFYIIRISKTTDMNIRDWIIPRRKVIVTPTTVAHMDSKAWNTGPKNEHPVDEFWVGRFLKYPSTSAQQELAKYVKQEDEHKFRCKVPECAKLFKEHHFWKTHLEKRHPECFEALKPHDPASSPVFSTKELEGSWIPYGGGPRQCPGRHFAKRQILLTIALMVSLFDCEILGDGKDMREDLSLKGFGGGMSRPSGEVPMRIRRREKSGM